MPAPYGLGERVPTTAMPGRERMEGVSADPEDGGGVVDFKEAGGVAGLGRGEDGAAEIGYGLPLLLGGGAGAAIGEELDGFCGEAEGFELGEGEGEDAVGVSAEGGDGAVDAGGAEAGGEGEGEPGEGGFGDEVGVGAVAEFGEGAGRHWGSG